MSPTRGTAWPLLLLAALTLANCGCATLFPTAVLLDFQEQPPRPTPRTAALPRPQQQQQPQAQLQAQLAPRSDVRPETLPVIPREFSEAEESRRVNEFPDEYVIDGGDRGDPVHYDEFLRYGVETEDTIAEYSDDTGKSHVLPTNRVAIYAPRFGAIRSVSLPIEGLAVQRLEAAHRLRREGRHSSRVQSRHHQLNATPRATRVRTRASGFLTEQLSQDLWRPLRVGEHSKLLNVFEETGKVVTGQMEKAARARLAKSLDNAEAWSADMHPKITATAAAGQSVRSMPWVETMSGVVIKQKQIGKLTILKLADRKTARSGEIVTFTIRFDNIGERPLHHVRIIDNLSPRLAYLPDTATLGFTDEADLPDGEAGRGGRITVDDNEQGSEVLVFELDEELPGGVGGVITFQARVR